MAKLNGIRIGAASINYVLQHPRFLTELAVVWAAIVTLAVVAMCVLTALSEQQDLATVMARMQDGDLARQYLTLTSITSIFGQLAVAIGWSRLVLLGEVPHLTWRMPSGSARYFSRSLILLFGVVALALPGVIVGAVAGSVIPGDAGKVTAGIIMGIGAIAAAYICLRAWLVFPAVAIGDDSMNFRRSITLTRGASLAIPIGTVLAYLPFLIVAIAIEMVAELFEGTAYASAMIIAEFLETLFLFGGIAAAAGVMAQIYRKVVPDFLNAQQADVFE